MIEAREELGESAGEALGRSLEQFGEPRLIGERWLQEWDRASPSESMGKAVLAGIRSFLPAALIGGYALTALGSRAPEAAEVLLLGLAVPAVAGLASGCSVRRWRLLAGCAGPAAVTLVSALFALAQGDHLTPMAHLAMDSFLCWLPVSCVAAELSGLLSHRLPRRKQTWKFLES